MICVARFQLAVPLEQMIRGQQSANDLRILAVELQHIYVLDELPLHRNDPHLHSPIQIDAVLQFHGLRQHGIGLS
jgi:hypothetical protein